eukprot:jgi/Picsp_1/5679/NSC_03038-R1_alpha beta hydrolase fold protein
MNDRTGPVPHGTIKNNRAIQIVSMVVISFVMISNGQVVQDLVPSQCDISKVLDPIDMTFMGQVKHAVLQQSNEVQKSFGTGEFDVSYHSFGPLSENVEKNETVVFINGFGTTQYDWPLELIKGVAVLHHCIIFDTPGVVTRHDSESNILLPDELSVDEITIMVGDFIKNLGIEELHLVGYSMGAMISLEMMKREQPFIIKSAALIAGTYGGPLAPQVEGGISSKLKLVQEGFLAKYPIESNPQSEGDNNNSNATESSLDINTLLFPNGSQDLGMCSLLRSYFSLLHAAGFMPLNSNTGYALVGSIMPSPLALVITNESMNLQRNLIENYFLDSSKSLDGLENISSQVLLVSGIDDQIIPVYTQTQLARQIPGVWLTQIPSAGHGVVFSSPPSIHNLLNLFFNASDVITKEMRSNYPLVENSGIQKLVPDEALLALFITSFLTILM